MDRYDQFAESHPALLEKGTPYSGRMQFRFPEAVVDAAAVSSRNVLAAPSTALLRMQVASEQG